MSLERADQLLVSRGLARSRSQAARWLRAGQVAFRDAGDGDWQVLHKPGHRLAIDTELRISQSNEDRFVSRAGAKLDAALDHTDIDVDGLTCLDIGMSTGGFTDCLLQRGATRMVGVDVGHDQLAPSLASDPRVVALEGINARELPRDALLRHAPGGFDVVVMDVSFISQTLILPGVPALLAPGGRLLSLVKPQFELDRAAIGKGGIVTDPAHFERVRRRIEDALEAAGFVLLDYFASAITGGDGNREFFASAVRDASSSMP